MNQGKTDSEDALARTPGTMSILLYRMRTHPWILAVLLLLIGGGYAATKLASHLLIDKQLDRRAAAAAQVYGEQQAAIINRFFAAENESLRIAADKPSVKRVLESMLPSAIRQMEQALKPRFPDALQLMLTTGSDDRISAGNNFLLREMAEKTLDTGETPAPELMKMDGEWVAIMIAPVSVDRDFVDGLVIQIIRLQKLVDQLWAKKLPGQTVLSRTSPRGRNVQIFSVGLPPGGFDLPSAVTPTELPHWSVEFKPGAGFIEQVSVSKTSYYIAVVALAALTIILMGATCSYALRRYRDEPTSAQEKEQHQRNKVAEDFDEQSYLVDLPLEAIGRYAEDEPADNIDEFMEEAPPEAPESLPDVVFRQYDIRGIYGSEITADFAFELGAAFASLALESGEDTLITGYDGRTSSPDLHQSLEQGILSTGCNVMALGAVTTPMFNLATHTRKETRSGIMVTASHNPPEYNGFKFCLDKSPLTAEAIQNLKTRMTEKNFREGLGETAQYDHITSDYLGAISENVMPANSLKVVVDAANGIAGSVAPDVLTLIGCEVIPLFCDVDGTFPNHPPDTSEEQNLVSLREAVLDHQADLGIALDGDGDRVVAISASGRIVWPDELLMIFARDMLARLPGSDIVFDVKSTRRLNKLVSNYGGRPVVYKTGHSNIRQKTRECDSPLGGEYSGHIFFRDRWHGFDDGLYAAVRLIEIITTREQPLDEIVEGFGQTFATPEIKIPVPEEAKFKLIEDLQEKCEFKNATVNRIDGLRVDYPKAWGLVRASNTSPALTLRFEADSAESLENIQSLFRKQISSIDARLTF